MKVTVEPLFVDLVTTALILSVSESTVQKMTREFKTTGFPQPRVISGRRVAYRLAEIKAWGEQRPISDIPPPPNTGAKKPRSRITPTLETQDDQQAA